MVLRIKKKAENRIFKVYMVAMFTLLVIRYLMKIHVPAMAFLMVSMLPIWWGSTNEQLAFATSCIPFSIAFQYKYALLVLAVAMLIKNHWRLKKSGLLILIVIMMAWELCHAFYGEFDYVEYLRGFAELIILGMVTSVDLKNVDHKLVIRTLAVSVVGVCMIMLIMQLQQNNFNLLAIFSRGSRIFRFGQENMKEGTFAINFNANSLGLICNLAACSCLLLAARKEHCIWDILLAILAVTFALMTSSRAAAICLIMILVSYLLLADEKLIKRIWAAAGGTLIVSIVAIILWRYLPSVFENLQARFERSDVWGGRSELFRYYGQFLFSSWEYALFGIGMQDIFGKVAPYSPVMNVPHNGIQEIWLAWGVVGVVMMAIVIWKIVTTSRLYADGERHLYQFVPLAMTLLFTMSGQLITSGRTLMTLLFAYICLCVAKKAEPTGKAV